jgi:kynurenine formamidase
VAGKQASSVLDLVNVVTGSRVYDLGHEIASTTPVLPVHTPFVLTLRQRHGDVSRPAASSFASEIVSMSLHTGTHIDALGHFSQEGRVHGGARAADIQAGDGLRALDAANLQLVIGRGVLLDVARHRGIEVLPPGSAIGADELARAADCQGIKIARGDVVLIHTGWSRHWGRASDFTGQTGGYPGIDKAAAEWLVSWGASVIGSDTPGVEQTPPGGVVHAYLLVHMGVPLIENLYLHEIAAEGVQEFLFVALPLKIVGGTGSPIRPVALCPSGGEREDSDSPP